MSGPHYMNFGAIGSIIGHEITHVFRNESIQIGVTGNNVDLLKPESKARYLEQIRCIIDQYDNYTEPLTGLKVICF